MPTQQEFETFLNWGLGLSTLFLIVGIPLTLIIGSFILDDETHKKMLKFFDKVIGPLSIIYFSMLGIAFLYWIYIKLIQ